jgi:hypothetical protein
MQSKRVDVRRWQLWGLAESAEVIHLSEHVPAQHIIVSTTLCRYRHTALGLLLMAAAWDPPAGSPAFAVLTLLTLLPKTLLFRTTNCTSGVKLFLSSGCQWSVSPSDPLLQKRRRGSATRHVIYCMLSSEFCVLGLGTPRSHVLASSP